MSSVLGPLVREISMKQAQFHMSGKMWSCSKNEAATHRTTEFTFWLAEYKTVNIPLYLAHACNEDFDTIIDLSLISCGLYFFCFDNFHESWIKKSSRFRLCGPGTSFTMYLECHLRAKLTEKLVYADQWISDWFRCSHWCWTRFYRLAMPA